MSIFHEPSLSAKQEPERTRTRDSSLFITAENYMERTRNMKSLSPEWVPDKRNLEANGMLAMLLEPERNAAFYIARPDEPATYEQMERSLASAWNDTKLPLGDPNREGLLQVQEAIGYSFANERLLLQAFTRRAYAKENNVFGDGDYEILELVGDSVLSAAVYKILLRQYSRFALRDKDGCQFICDYREGDLSKIKQKFTDKAALGKRCMELGFDKYIRYGKDEPANAIDPKEDVVEAIVGAVAIDSGWDMDILEEVVENILGPHLVFDPWNPRDDAFDTLNSWYQRKHGRRPEYRTWKSGQPGNNGEVLYECDLWMLDGRSGKTEPVPEGHAVFRMEKRDGEDYVVFHSRRETKSTARSMAAYQGLKFLKENGLFLSLADAGIEPDLEKAVTQLEILSQRGIVGKAEYEFTDQGDFWECSCRVDSFEDTQDGGSKKAAKKKAAFGVLTLVMKSGGVYDPMWDKMFEECGKS